MNQLRQIHDHLMGLAAERIGYRVLILPREDFVTCYLVSHKGRAVGAVAVYHDGSQPEEASSPYEANEWYAADQSA